MRRISLLAPCCSLLIFALGAALGVGCGSSPSPPPQPPPGPTATVTTTMTATNPTATASGTTSAPPATTTAATASAPAELQLLLTPLAHQHAAGAKPEGPPITGMLQPGQPLQASVTLAASGARCYTVIALGAPLLTDLQIELVATPPAPLPPFVLAQSQSPANPAILAGSPNCFKNLSPLPTPATVKITSKTGSGPVAAQVYAK
ncbi:MAG: hypothetical protein MUF64_14830 [Polyangiaceae bacterium]|nr:hypothetical protein [Polyangiaceae bacterium]